jgi:hypothetical protein
MFERMHHFKSIKTCKDCIFNTSICTFTLRSQRFDILQESLKEYVITTRIREKPDDERKQENRSGTAEN